MSDDAVSKCPTKLQSSQNCSKDENKISEFCSAKKNKRIILMMRKF